MPKRANKMSEFEKFCYNHAMQCLDGTIKKADLEKTLAEYRSGKALKTSGMALKFTIRRLKTRAQMSKMR
jgi:hypothetical protein